jgi:hypothetical protein
MEELVWLLVSDIVVIFFLAQLDSKSYDYKKERPSGIREQRGKQSQGNVRKAREQGSEVGF